MKKFSKILSVALIIALVMSMGISSAFAASITINHSNNEGDTNEESETYKAYKILDAVVPEGHEVNDQNVGKPISEELIGYTYTISSESAWFNAVSTSGYFDLSERKLDDNGEPYYIVVLKENLTANANQAKTMAAHFKQYAEDNNISPDKTLTLDEQTNVDNGYWLIVSSLGENLVLATTDITITEKNQYPGIDKTEKDEDKSAYIGVGLFGVDDFTDYDKNSVNVAIGDTIEYQVKVSIPSSANQDVIVTDTMSAGLTYDATTGLSFSGASISEDADYEIVAPGEDDTYTWKVVFKANNNTKGKEIVISFKATVNSDALIVDKDKKNEVTLDYSNFSQKDFVNYLLCAVGIHKYDGNTNEDLAGVEFKLFENNDEFKVSPVTKTEIVDGEEVTTVLYYIADPENGSSKIVTGTDGVIIIRGLDDDKTYSVEETKSLTGYNPVQGKIVLQPLYGDTGEDVVITNHYNEIENNKGTQLPSTGGIGTTIFYVVGGVLVLAAIILLVTKKRMSE